MSDSKPAPGCSASASFPTIGIPASLGSVLDAGQPAAAPAPTLLEALSELGAEMTEVLAALDEAQARGDQTDFVVARRVRYARFHAERLAAEIESLRKAARLDGDDRVRFPSRRAGVATRRRLAVRAKSGLDAGEESRIRARYARLTPRECEVMHLIAKRSTDTSSKAIARKLGISHRTVETHRARVMKKMAARSVADLVAMALVCEPPQASVAPADTMPMF